VPGFLKNPQYLEDGGYLQQHVLMMFFVFCHKKFVKDFRFVVMEVVAVSGVGPGDYGGMQPGRVYFKMRKVYFESSNKTYICWSSMWTRMDLKLKDRIEFDNAVKVLGVADNAGSYTMKDEFGNTFRSFFIACDFQDLWAAAVYFQQVKIV
jgi:hypothetical protein